MQRIIGSRGVGKSSQLILYAHEHNIPVIICSSPMHQIELAQSLGVSEITFIGYNEKERIKNVKNTDTKFLIDDLEKFTSYKYKNLIGYTISIN